MTVGTVTDPAVRRLFSSVSSLRWCGLDDVFRKLDAAVALINDTTPRLHALTAIITREDVD